MGEWSRQAPGLTKNAKKIATRTGNEEAEEDLDDLAGAKKITATIPDAVAREDIYAESAYDKGMKLRPAPPSNDIGYGAGYVPGKVGEKHWSNQSTTHQMAPGFIEKTEENGRLVGDAQEKLSGVKEQEAYSEATNTAREAAVSQALYKRQAAEKADQVAKYDAAINDLRNSNVDPNRYWSSLGAGRRIGMTIAAMFGGLASRQSGGRNTAIEMLNRGIDRDIAAQTADIDKKKNLVGYFYQKLGLVDQAQTAAKQVMLEGFKLDQRRQAAFYKAQGLPFEANIQSANTAQVALDKIQSEVGKNTAVKSGGGSRDVMGVRFDASLGSPNTKSVKVDPASERAIQNGSRTVKLIDKTLDHVVSEAVTPKWDPGNWRDEQRYTQGLIQRFAAPIIHELYGSAVSRGEGENQTKMIPTNINKMFSGVRSHRELVKVLNDIRDDEAMKLKGLITYNVGKGAHVPGGFDADRWKFGGKKKEDREKK